MSTQVATRNRALRVHGPGDLRLEEVRAPDTGDHEALVKIGYGGICGSDLHYARDGAVGPFVLRDPMVLGHEVVGTVARAASDGSGPAEGQAVAVHPATSCGTCRWCLGGESRLCPQARYLGSAAQRPHTDGGFTDLLSVATHRLVPIPDGLTLRRAALAEPTSIAWHAVSRGALIGPGIDGADVVVIGAGPIGLLVAAVSRYRGAGMTTVVDLYRYPLEVGTRVGVDRAIAADQLRDGGDELEGDVVFECSGTPAGLRTALRSARRGGTVVQVGIPPAGEQPVEAALIVGRELTVLGSLRMDTELEAAVAFLADREVKVDPLISHVLPADQAVDAFALASDPNLSTATDYGEIRPLSSALNFA
jgi:L-idonate 5-dehydrogenase